MTATFHILTSCPYDRAYQDLKGFSKNGDHFCKQLLSILQQRFDLHLKCQASLCTRCLCKKASLLQI
uniref:Nitric oxide synthase trafficking n=1 Tax=Varanus komodoensis TaxID=61221 RepID=A0A8D2LW38_VARKO